jgi:5'-nucleotidase
MTSCHPWKELANVNRSTTLKLGTIVLAAAAVVGCQNKSSEVPTSSSVTDVSAAPSTPTASAYTPPQTTAAAQPVTYDTMPAYGTTGATGGTSISSGPYTVKRGDTLYSIARKSYGDGKQWQKIAAANPGLRPESLKVGQTIQIP